MFLLLLADSVALISAKPYSYSGESSPIFALVNCVAQSFSFSLAASFSIKALYIS
jgi:hypothetical protein